MNCEKREGILKYGKNVIVSLNIVRDKIIKIHELMINNVDKRKRRGRDPIHGIEVSVGD